MPGRTSQGDGSQRQVLRRVTVALAVVAAVSILNLDILAQSGLRSPEQAFGFRMGADRKLISWSESVGYFQELARSSGRVKVFDAGKTTMGKPLILVAVSSEENIASLGRYRDIVRQLSDPRRTSEEAASRLAAEGKVIVLLGCSIHGAEIGSAQMAPELVHRLITEDFPQARRILDNVIFLLFPSMNPDGMDLVVDWYKSTVGTPWEGGSMPWLYNKYVGHDINRDFFMLNMTENRLAAKVLYEEWKPQVFLSQHQMGATGPRMFVPPNFEPVDPNYEPLIWRQAGLLGHAMATELESRGMKGVITNAMYDYFFPGYEDSGPIGHNTVCMLTEAASARLASPTTVKREQLTGTPKGLPDYQVTQNFPNPWEGGEWHLRDIVEYDMYAVLGWLDGAAKYSHELLHNYYRMARNQIEKAKTQAPFAFVVPAAQRDPLTAAKMINILRMASVEVWRARSPFEADGRSYGAGSYVILMEQPFRAYAKTLLEKQTYPTRRLYPGGPQERPYDVTGWTLPLQMGVDTVAVKASFAFDRERVDRATPPAVDVTAKAALVFPADFNDSFIAANRVLKDGGNVMRATSPMRIGEVEIAAGAFVVPVAGKGAKAPEYAKSLGIPATALATVPKEGLVVLAAPRVGLYKPWTASMDEGWTRWLFEQYEVPFSNISDLEVKGGNLRSRFDVIVIPAIRGTSIIEGNRPGSTDPKYTGGIGNEGVASLKEFIANGGTLVTIGESTLFAIEHFGLPVRDVLAGLKPEVFFCPGSILRTSVDPTHPVGFGMPSTSIAYFQNNHAFETLAAFGTAQPRTIVKYADSDILLSGWIEGPAQLASKAAAVDVPVGKGRVILFGFGVQRRAQPHATFKLLFNSLFYAVTTARTAT
ncbi:MAG: M14 metallopeptidase family protein [Vicinamibacterales bacterium]